MMWILKRLFIASLMLFAGCGLFFNTESVDLVPVNANNQNNTNNENNNTGLPLGNGTTCPDPDNGTFDKTICDPVAQTGCDPGDYCFIAVQDGQLLSACRELEPDPDNPGEPCVTLSCAPGYFCVRDLGVCARICDRPTARGCRTSSVCTPFEGTSIGFCTDECM